MSGFGSNNSSGGNGKFNGNRLVTRQGLPAINIGQVKDVAEWVDKYFFPVMPPGAAIIGGNMRQFGASPAVTLIWAATKNTNAIEQIVVAGESIPATGNTQSGSKAVSATQNVNTTFSMSVKAGADTATASTAVTWSHKRYWGKMPPQNGALPIPTDAQITAFSGAGVGAGSEFASSRVKTYNGINGAGEHLLFAFPTSWGIPSFVVNGLPNTAFTKVRDDLFVNSNGYAENFQVWVSNTVQNSPIAKFEIQ